MKYTKQKTNKNENLQTDEVLFFPLGIGCCLVFWTFNAPSFVY